MSRGHASICSYRTRTILEGEKDILSRQVSALNETVSSLRNTILTRDTEIQTLKIDLQYKDQALNHTSKVSVRAYTRCLVWSLQDQRAGPSHAPSCHGKTGVCGCGCVCVFIGYPTCRTDAQFG